MIRSWIAAIAVVAVSWAAPAPAHAQTEAASREFVAYMQSVSAILEHAGQANDAMHQFSAAFNAAPTREEKLAILPRIRGVTARARQTLSDARAELAALQPYNGVGATADMVELGSRQVPDTNAYLDNLVATLDAIDEMMTGIEASNDRLIQNALPKLQTAMINLLAGQVTVLRARQAIFTSSDTTYHSLGCMIALYQGMGALMPGNPNRVRDLTAAADSAQRWGSSGRVTLATERASLDMAPPQTRRVMLPNLRFEEQFLDINDRVEAMLRDAVAGRIDDPNALHELASFEIQYQEVATAQVQAASNYLPTPQ